MPPCSFHPTMVLAQQKISESIIRRWYVSIPLWFSLNVNQPNRKRFGYVRFHPTMVLAQRDVNGNVLKSESFHPTMVLAQLMKGLRPLRSLNVSIPLWFSLNKIRETVPVSSSTRFHPTMVLAQHTIFHVIFRLHTVFPSHYGSRSTREMVGRLKTRLSFPSHYGSRSTYTLSLHWWPAGCRFHPTMVLAQHEACVRNHKENIVSIPLWFSLNPHQQPHLFVAEVSIPLWFSLNVKESGGYRLGLEFPSHYGSRSTKSWQEYDVTEVVRFHPTMVLAQHTPKPPRTL